MSFKLDILFEDNHLLVVNKPPLVATMGAAEGEPSLHQLAQDYIRYKYNKPGNVFIGVVSRLDAFVTGVIALARTSKAASRLSDQFRTGIVQKTYWALIPDSDLPTSGALDDWLQKNDARRRMEVVPNDSNYPNAKHARLKYKTLSCSNGVRLIEIELETGRKHQIRVQFENAGAPILGDRKYGSQRRFHKGIALHCRRLEIIHPTKKVSQSFQTTPPDWWNLDQFSI